MPRDLILSVMLETVTFKLSTKESDNYQGSRRDKQDGTGVGLPQGQNTGRMYLWTHCGKSPRDRHEQERSVFFSTPRKVLGICQSQSKPFLDRALPGVRKGSRRGDTMLRG